MMEPISRWESGNLVISALIIVWGEMTNITLISRSDGRVMMCPLLELVLKRRLMHMGIAVKMKSKANTFPEMFEF